MTAMLTSFKTVGESFTMGNDITVTANYHSLKDRVVIITGGGQGKCGPPKVRGRSDVLYRMVSLRFEARVVINS